MTTARARVTFLRTGEGGRRTPAQDGYRPHIQVGSLFTSCIVRALVPGLTFDLGSSYEVDLEFVFWAHDGEVRDLGTGLGYGSGSHANGINNAGLVVGARVTAQGAPERAVIWRNGAIRELGTFGGTAGRFGTESIAYGVNEAGHVVGAALPPSGPLHAFVWNGRRLRDLGTLGGNNEATSARDINDAGQITGYSPNADGRVHAFRWDRGVMRDLGVPTGATSSFGYGINNRGQVVGSAGFGEFLDPDAHDRAVIWQDGVMTDLRTLVDDLPPDVNLLTGQAINDDGVIVGSTCVGTCYSDERRIPGPAFMLVPKSPEA